MKYRLSLLLVPVLSGNYIFFSKVYFWHYKYNSNNNKKNHRLIIIVNDEDGRDEIISFCNSHKIL